ncbi:MAG: hypothetical protein LBI02_07490 [Opitutaceae bacterium]|jgi:sugar lactone lactonase YvrE|nr:hypothetical protein [Opitutaceae bacterium]
MPSSLGNPNSRFAAWRQAARRPLPRPSALFALLLAALAPSAPSALEGAPPATANTILLEPETFAAHGGWEIRPEGDGTKRAFIRSVGTGGSALAGFTLAEPGACMVWALSCDYSTSPGTRLFQVSIDQNDPGKECGEHDGMDDREGWYWYWEKALAAPLTLDAGLHTIEVKHIQSNGRLEALLITSADFDPNTVTRDALDVYNPDHTNNHSSHALVQAVRVPVATSELATPDVIDGDDGVAARLQNADQTVRFRRAQTVGGQDVLLREVEFRTGAAAGQIWRARLEPVHLIRADAAASPITYGWEPGWKSVENEEWELAGHTWPLPVDTRNAFLAGNARARYLPVQVKSSGDGASVTLRYALPQETAAAATAAGLPAEIAVTWSLPETGFAARMEPMLTVTQDGWYSLAFAAAGAGGFADTEVAAVQLPWLYQFKRLPDVPSMLMSSLASHPLALVETLGALPLTHGVVADPDRLATEWAMRDNATHGFSLRGRENGAQPVVFSPILGGRDSKIDAGATLNAAWWVLTSPRPWLETMRDADTGVLRLRDYREPWTSSLTWQALNMIKLIQQPDTAFRWYDNLKGPSNIEAPSTATQSAPLMLVSAALLTRDPGFYQKRGLPSLEYALSRPYVHYALISNEEAGVGYVNYEADTRLSFRNRSFGTATWQGFDELLGGLNPWLRDNMKTPGGQVRPTSGVPTWSEKLALYRSTRDPALLAETTADAKSWAATAFNPSLETPKDRKGFYNYGAFYPYWWDLLDLYELTGDPELLARARQGAAQTAAGVWVHPVVPEGATLTLYPGGHHENHRTNWYDNDDRFRLGWPAGWPAGATIVFDSQRETTLTNAAGTFTIPAHPEFAEKTVPAWLPATAGFGVEADTYYAPADMGMGSMQNTVWVANLLRLAGHTGEDYWRIHARNGIIGRGANYPGYYINLYMDLQHDPDYPNQGPDLNSFYWHHVPVHLASIVDYIMTDADVRTRGAIRFPYVKSQGYVWFSSRIYGGSPGRIFDDPACRLWLDNIKFNVDTHTVDYFGAQSAGKFHLVLLNQAHDATAAKVSIDAAALGIAPLADARLRDATGAVSALPPDGEGRYPVALARGGWAVLTFDATPDDAWPACPPLSEKPLTTTIDTAWGDLHAFRIRSPHGADSFYVGLTGVPEGGRMTLQFEDAAGALRTIGVKTEKPYELSAHDIPLGDAIRFKLRLERTGAPALETTTRILNGTAPAAPAGLSASDLGAGRARLAWQPAPGAVAYQIKRAASPGGAFRAIAKITAPPAGAPPGHTDSGLSDNQTYYYTVSAINTYGESPDSAATAISIVNHAAPEITTQPPAQQNTPCGTPLTLSISATENGLTYQWQRDGVDIPGATTPALALAGAPADAGIYRVRVTGQNGSTLSEPAEVTITPGDATGPLLAPATVVVDDAGILYVSDTENHAIHILTPPDSPAVYINTFAGAPGHSGATDGPAAQALFNRPLGLAARARTLYVADFGNGALRAITADREVGTLATGDIGGPAGITTDTAGNIYAADRTAHVIRKINAATGDRSLIAGKLETPGADDGPGPGARFHAPAGIAWTPGPTAAGLLYIADTGNHVIRKVDLDDANRVTTLAGNAGVPGWMDGAGDDALFNHPEGITADIDGTLYIADTGNSLVREIAPGGWVGTVAGAPDAGALAGLAGFKDATGTAALFNQPRGVALGRGRELYIADTGNRAIRRIGLDNKVQTLLAISPGQNPPPPDNAGGGGGGGGGGALSPWSLIAFAALFLSKATPPRRKPAPRPDAARK